MTFVIIGGGIDLSVGAIAALASVWCTTVATQTMAEDTHWLAMVGVAMAVAARLRVDQRAARSRTAPIVPFIATLAMLASARGLAEIIANRRTQIVKVDGFNDFLRGDFLGISVLIWIFALVSLVGWVVLNRTTFGRRTVAVGGNPEAARLAGINVKWHTVMLYVLVGFCCGIAALMITARTTTGVLDARRPLGARRHRRRRHRRHPAHRWPGHHRRHRVRRADLRDAHERLRPEQPLQLGAERRQGRDHRARRPAPAAPRRLHRNKTSTTSTTSTTAPPTTVT